MIGWMLTGKNISAEIGAFLDKLGIKDHKILILNAGDITYTVEQGLTAKLWYRGEAIDPPDFFLVLMVDSEGEELYALARQLTELGSLSYNSMEAKQIAKSKIATYQLLAKAGLPIPKTFVFSGNADKAFLIKELGLPMVIKPDDGCGGKGVELINTEDELEEALERVRQSPQLMLVQEYVATSRGRDVRVMTVAHEPVFAACRKASNPDEFRSNISAGGHREDFEMTEEVKILSHKVSKAIGLNYAGIDLMFGRDGFVVGEVNSSPGYRPWINKIDIFSILLNGISDELKRRPYPYWKFTRLMDRARDEQLAAVMMQMSDDDFFKAEAALMENCERVQETVLSEMLAASADTEFGRRYGFSEIKSVREYRAKVPLSEWADYRDDAKRLENGEADILFPGGAEFFYRTSGTTDTYKQVPESGRSSICRGAITRSRLARLFRYLPDGKLHKALVLTNKSVADTTEAGIHVGSASGHSLGTLGAKFIPLLAVPVTLVDHYSGDDLLYMTLRCALTHERMTCIGCNNALSFVNMAEFGALHADELISDIRSGLCGRAIPDELADEMHKYLAPNPERADFLERLNRENRFHPLHYWSDISLGCFWLGGSLATYVERAKRYLPTDIHLLDVGYGASEIKINIPMRDGTAAGALATFCGFFEFIPEEGGEPLLAHEVKEGQNYELVVTTYSGLYRYRMKDLVHVDGFTGDTPNIYFVSTLTDMANLAMEKLSGNMLSDALRKTLDANGLSLRAVRIYPDAVTMSYHICIELENPEKAPPDLESVIEQGLQERLIRYKIFRQTDLKEAKLHLMKRGWGEHLVQKYTKNSSSSAQVKVPVVTNTMPEDF